MNYGNTGSWLLFSSFMYAVVTFGQMLLGK